MTLNSRLEAGPWILQMANSETTVTHFSCREDRPFFFLGRPDPMLILVATSSLKLLNDSKAIGLCLTRETLLKLDQETQASLLIPKSIK